MRLIDILISGNVESDVDRFIFCWRDEQLYGFRVENTGKNYFIFGGVVGEKWKEEILTRDEVKKYLEWCGVE